MTDFWIQDGETMLFIGDSITDCGRRAEHAPLGSGYVRIFSELATARMPERRIDYVNRGIGGNTIVDLRDRWQNDVLDVRPDRLAVKIGINDIHRHLRRGEGAVDVALFEETYDHILNLTRRKLDVPMALISPFYILKAQDADRFERSVLDLLPDYIAVVEKMSHNYNTLYLDLHQLFQHHLDYRDADAFCPEPVHPHPAGHMVIANALLDLFSQA